ncbi:MAG: hypothetical protein HOQ03_03605 [Thermoleophilia bacterium]|nr:hypothetical protein [Thermoleophilia bacterium]
MVAAARHRFPAGAVGALELVLLSPLSAILALVEIPRSFGIQSACVVAGLGVVRIRGDAYIEGFTVLGAVGWLAVFAGMLAAGIAERRTVVLLLPAVWFAVYVLAALAVAVPVGPAPCPA